MNRATPSPDRPGLLSAELPYHRDPCRYFHGLVAAPWAVFLDSAGTPAGRYDLLMADPVATVVTRAGITEVSAGGGVEQTAEDPFAVLRRIIGPPLPSLEGVPFAGGLAGWLGYDLARRIERLPAIASDGEELPELAMGVYDWALVVDHQEGRARLVSRGRHPATARRWEALVRRFSAPRAPAAGGFRLAGPLRTNLGWPAYAAAFDRVRRYIHDGDCYQVNLARRFEAPATGDPWALYRRLRVANPAPYAGFLRTPFATVLSSSPERFLAVCDGMVETRPIKGTRPRSPDPAEDGRQAAALAASAKDRAENLMIVDLLRNDLGRSCVPGSIHVPELFKVESFQAVHHLVSTVRGRLAPGRDALHLLRGCFPGGSITGAPKLRAMEIIEELEPHRRGVYCGAIGYLGFDGSLDTNIAIRTLVYSHGRLRLWAGGGIVADSEAAAEFEETEDKARAMLDALAEPGGKGG